MIKNTPLYQVDRISQEVRSASLDQSCADLSGQLGFIEKLNIWKKQVGNASNDQHLADQICADFPSRLGSAENSPTARHFLVKTARAAGIQLTKIRRCVKGVGFLKGRARHLLIKDAPIYQASSDLFEKLNIWRK